MVIESFPVATLNKASAALVAVSSHFPACRAVIAPVTELYEQIAVEPESTATVTAPLPEPPVTVIVEVALGLAAYVNTAGEALTLRFD
ncbi:unannotated protein [freshwater metagenome]|uniref:Unannotated protein n=1 Tax=freshwater metagenome TaxID=449393 RepID=A0A6J6MZ32_9ZZZZ